MMKKIITIEIDDENCPVSISVSNESTARRTKTSRKKIVLAERLESELREMDLRFFTMAYLYEDPNRTQRELAAKCGASAINWSRSVHTGRLSETISRDELKRLIRDLDLNTISDALKKLTALQSMIIDADSSAAIHTDTEKKHG